MYHLRSLNNLFRYDMTMSIIDDLYHNYSYESAFLKMQSPKGKYHLSDNELRRARQKLRPIGESLIFIN